MNSPIIIAAADAAESPTNGEASTEVASNPVDKIVDTFHLNTSLFVSQLIVFVTVLLVLKKFAYGPILGMLEKRRQMIAESHENSQKIKVELAEAAATRKQLIEQASAQANKIIDEAKTAANLVRETETQKAIAQAEDIISKARQVAESDRDRMMDELKKEVGRMVVQTTTQVVGKVLSDEDKNRLIDEANKSIAA